ALRSQRGDSKHTAKEGGMTGKMGWVLGLALAWTGTRGAWAQLPQAGAGQDVPKTDAAAPAAPAAATAGSPMIPMAPPIVQPRLYTNVDYLLWWVHRGPLPEQPLVTTGPQNPQSPNAGIIGQPGTQTLFGGPNGLDWRASSGARVTLGSNFSDEGT